MNNNLKVAICISGSLREFKNCWENINENVVQQFDSDIFLKCWKASDEVEQWHGDSKTPLDTCTPEEALEIIGNKLIKYSFEMFNKEKESIFDLYGKKYTRLQHPDFGQKKVINCLSMFYNIFECNKLQKEHSENSGKVYDYVIRIRPDLYFKYPFDESKIVVAQNNNLIGVPSKYNHNGTNDQLAWGRPLEMNKYSECYNNIQNLYNSGCIFHPETFLKEHLRYVGLNVVNSEIEYIIKRPNESVKF